VVGTPTAKSVAQPPPRLVPSPSHATTPAFTNLSPASLAVSSNESHTHHIDDAPVLNGRAEERLCTESLVVKEDASPLSLPNNTCDDSDVIIAKRQRDAQREECRRVAREKMVKLERTLANTTVRY
jgi:hypothetical protein